jgi:diguanylate cyclase (GGDEF)-like protein/PAS domain S-box-containing protein
MDRYELAAQGADNGLWDWDLTTSRLHYSSGWLSMLGCAESECGSTSDDWFKRIHPEDLEPVQREIASHLEKGSTQFEIQHRMLHQDGCYRWMSCCGVIARDDSGRAVRITGYHVDITSKIVVDALTGLPNRLLLLDRLARSIEKARKQEDFLYAVLVVDLDLSESGIHRLETMNGDSIVVAAARRLETSLRTKDGFSREGHSDLVTRSGGEEFTILLEGLGDLGEAKSVAERLLKVILAPFAFGGHELSLSASIGIALSATGYRKPDEALRDANTALHRAKSLGKSRCEIFDTAIVESAQTRQQLEKDLHGALNRHEFLVFYQPILSLTTNQIAGCEALVRWEHPSRGMLLPGEFLPVAEKTGFIVSLNGWVLREACRQLKAWQRNPRIPKGLWVSVNLSGSQFMQPSLVKEIREILLEAGADASGLVLELTEGIVMESPEAARSVMMQLRVMGTRIALDDFGTGYSSLAHLRRFPLDFLKIDYSFVRSIENTSDALEIIRAIKSMAQQLGLRVIAEGIENPSQLDLIRSLDCEYGQGFLFSRAVCGDEAERLLLNGASFCEEVLLPAPSPEKSGREISSSQKTSSAIGVRGSAQRSGRKRIFAPKRKWVVLGIAAPILLFMGALLGKLNRSTVPPAASTRSPSLPVPHEGPGKKVASPQIAEILAPAVIQKPPAVVPKAARAKLSASVHTYPVEHDHRFGGCKGVLKIAQNTISFVSDNNKDSFDFEYSQCSYALDRDQLTIKAGSKVFRFKSATALTKDENRTHLLDILQKISKFHPSPSTKQ